MNIGDITPKFIEFNQIEEIQIIGDGNCFYRCLSQDIDKTQENHRYYRELIYNYIVQHQKLFIKFFDRKDNENTEEYYNRYNTFINTIQNNATYAGDFEISAASIILNKKIIIYYNSLSGYNLLNEYIPNVNTKECIYIVYRNNIHFNVLKFKNQNIDKEIDKEITLEQIDAIHNKIELEFKKQDLNKIEIDKFKFIFDKKYVKYRRTECQNLYNEIYKYLSEEKLPQRLISPFMKNVEEYWKKKKIMNSILLKIHILVKIIMK